MSRLLLLPLAACFAGLVLLFAEIGWFARRPLADRLRPYAPGGVARTERAGVLSVASFREVIAPLASGVGARLASLLGVDEDLAVRLERVHATVDPTTFRLRQLGWSAGAFAAAVLACGALRPPGAAAALFVLGAPLLAFLLVEHRLAAASAARQQRIFTELPVVAEQLAMLLGAGYSLGAGLQRLSERGAGACSTDLARVVARVRTGLSEVEALREWAAVARVDALDRLVGVLALNREATDLGRLIGDEARAIRRDAQRRLLESIERRNQQVWIPVTVATLIPGVIFMAVPFVDALSLFSRS